MIADLSPYTFAFVATATLCAGAVRGFSGFGFALVAVPALSLVMPVREIVPLVYLLELAATARMLPRAWAIIDWPSLRWLLPPALIATPIGVYLLAEAPNWIMRLAISGVVLCATVALFRHYRLQRRPGPGPTMATGALSGLLNGATGMPGPPVIIYYLAAPITLAAGRATIVALYAVLYSGGITASAYNGMVSRSTLELTGLLAVFLLAGVGLGSYAFDRSTAHVARTSMLILMAVIALASLVSALMGLA